MNSVKKTDRKINKRGFTMIELIGAMVIIAILTVAGITAIATAISNSRMSATQTDLSGFQTPIEQFLLENPQMAKSNDTVAIATKLNEYLEGEMQFAVLPDEAADDDEDYTTSSNTGFAGKWITKRLDAWDQPFRIYIDTAEHAATNGTDAAKDSEIRIFVVSNGKNSTTGCTGGTGNRYLDGTDDMFLMVQLVNGQVSHGMYGMRDGDSKFVLDDAGTTPPASVNQYAENGKQNEGSIQDLNRVSLAGTVSTKADGTPITINTTAPAETGPKT